MVMGNGWSMSNCLHRSGLVALLWDALRGLGYTQPPTYVGKEFTDFEVTSCIMHVVVPDRWMYPANTSWMVTVEGYSLENTWDIAAIKALTKLCGDFLGQVQFAL